MHYFSYGSNMSIKRFMGRVPSAKKVGMGMLDRHELRFHKIGRKDGSGKCDVVETGLHEHIVYGVVFHISTHEKPVLDRVEGLHFGYEEKTTLNKAE